MIVTIETSKLTSRVADKTRIAVTVRIHPATWKASTPPRFAGRYRRVAVWRDIVPRSELDD